MEEFERPVEVVPHFLAEVWDSNDLLVEQISGNGARVTHKPTGEVSVCLWAWSYPQNVSFAIANLKQHLTTWRPGDGS